MSRNSGGHFWEMPFPAYYPAKLDKSGYNYNPAGSIPGPVPKVYTVPGLWVGGKIPLQSRFNPGTAPVERTLTWSTPVFDLRPELRAATGAATTNAVPLWRQLFGVGGKLWIQFSRWDSNASSKTGLRVLSREFSHIIDSEQMAQIGDDDDVTGEVTGTSPSSLLIFTPPGDGYPVRYWRLEITIDYLLAHEDPDIVLQAAYY